MKNRIYKLSLITALMSICSYGHASWQKVLECSNGAVIIDQDDNNPQRIQVVVRDSGIARYLAEGTVAPTCSALNEPNIGFCFDSRELIVRSYNSNSLSNFKSMVGYTAGSSDPGPSAQRTYYFKVTHEYGGLKLQVASDGYITMQYVDENQGHYNTEFHPSYKEGRNWFFQNCISL